VVAGSTLVVDRRFSRRSFWATVAEYGVTWVNVVPAIIGVLAQSDPPDPDERSRVRFARSAAAPLPLSTAALFEQRCGVSVLETYGMTEAASQITANPLSRADRRPGSVGRPVGVELRVVDDSRRPVPAGTSGEIEIRGTTVVSDYWATGDEAPASWPATDAEGWLGTGDVGSLDEDGFLRLLARSDDVINRGGEKIYPGEVEDALLGDERVTGAVVVARPHEIAGAVPVAFVTARVPTESRTALIEDLHRRCAAALSRAKCPAAVTVVDILPAGPTGKVRRAELRRTLATAAT
jgi:acyl-CoA synthetase (AMP-forming)/AMP-acid ligase II